jgi:hypothetical protein
MFTNYQKKLSKNRCFKPHTYLRSNLKQFPFSSAVLNYFEIEGADYKNSGRHKEQQGYALVEEGEKSVLSDQVPLILKWFL